MKIRRSKIVITLNICTGIEMDLDELETAKKLYPGEKPYGCTECDHAFFKGF